MKFWMKAIALGAVMFQSALGGAATSGSAQLNVNQEGLAAHGYDLVAYFDQRSAQGRADFEAEYQGAKYRFESKENMTRFLSTPDDYLPQYGGWCATAVAMKMKLDIDPEKFLVARGKLFLFSNVNGNDARAMWLKDPAGMKEKADRVWAEWSAHPF